MIEIFGVSTFKFINFADQNVSNLAIRGIDLERGISSSILDKNWDLVDYSLVKNMSRILIFDISSKITMIEILHN